MPYFFAAHGAQWQALPLSSSGHLSLAPLAFQPSATPDGARPFLLRVAAEGAAPRWVLLVGSAPGARRVRHNGRVLTAGLRALAHRDALAVEGQPPVWFSTETRATVAPYAEAAPARCPRCRDDIAAGAPSVRCPTCNVVHHQSADRDCWTYAAACAVCAQPTALNAPLQWSPEEI